MFSEHSVSFSVSRMVKNPLGFLQSPTFTVHIKESADDHCIGIGEGPRQKRMNLPAKI